MHVGNFVARAVRVKQHGAILGMQMRCNGAGSLSPRQSVIPGVRWREPQMCHCTAGNLDPITAKFRVRRRAAPRNGVVDAR